MVNINPAVLPDWVRRESSRENYIILMGDLKDRWAKISGSLVSISDFMKEISLVYYVRKSYKDINGKRIFFCHLLKDDYMNYPFVVSQGGKRIAFRMTDVLYFESKNWVDSDKYPVPDYTYLPDETLQDDSLSVDSIGSLKQANKIKSLEKQAQTIAHERDELQIKNKELESQLEEIKKRYLPNKLEEWLPMLEAVCKTYVQILLDKQQRYYKTSKQASEDKIFSAILNKHHKELKHTVEITNDVLRIAWKCLPDEYRKLGGRPREDKL